MFRVYGIQTGSGGACWKLVCAVANGEMDGLGNNAGPTARKDVLGNVGEQDDLDLHSVVRTPFSWT